MNPQALIQKLSLYHGIEASQAEIKKHFGNCQDLTDDHLPQIAKHLIDERGKQAEKQFKKDQSITIAGASKKPGRSIEVVAGMYEYLGNESALYSPIELEERKFAGARGLEYVYSDALAKALGGKREVATPAGFIDVLTDSELIEVKFSPCWKHAVGQVSMYGLYYPLHQKRIHLFGPITKERLLSIVKWAGQVGVSVTHEK